MSRLRAARPNCASVASLLLAAAALVGPTPAAAADSSPPLSFYWHRENYAIASYDENGRNGIWDQVKFQFSLRTVLVGQGPVNVVFGFTQKSFWDVAGKSSPFLATDFNPELFVEYLPEPAAIPFVRLGFEHESNGRSEGTSRSWDRGFLSVRLATGAEARRNLATAGDRRVGGGAYLEAKGWVYNADDDEDDAFNEYAGYWELTGDASYRREGRTLGLPSELLRNFGVHARLRGLPAGEGDRGFVEIGARVGLLRTVQLYVQYFRGYGEQLARFADDGWESGSVKAGLSFRS